MSYKETLNSGLKRGFEVVLETEDLNKYINVKFEEFNNITGNTFVITPQSGDLFLFPSHLPHQSFANNSDCDRICVSFNYTLHGSWGTSTQYISI